MTYAALAGRTVAQTTGQTTGLMGGMAVGYDSVETPIGRIFVGLSDRGLCSVMLDASDEATYRSRLSGRGVTLRRDREMAKPALTQIEAYFAGRLRSFSLPIDLRGVRLFTARVLEAARSIPFGSLTTYGDLARQLGCPDSSRAVGQALGRNPIPIVVPCHRVVARGGHLGGFTGGIHRKRALLTHEGHDEIASGLPVADVRAG